MLSNWNRQSGPEELTIEKPTQLEPVGRAETLFHLRLFLSIS